MLLVEVFSDFSRDGEVKEVVGPFVSGCGFGEVIVNGEGFVTEFDAVVAGGG